MRLINQNTVTLFRSIIGDGAFPLRDLRNDRDFSASGIEAGGQINCTDVTGNISIADATGVVLYSGALAGNVTIDPIPRGVLGPITATITSYAEGASPSLEVYWSVRK